MMAKAKGQVKKFMEGIAPAYRGGSGFTLILFLALISDVL